MKYNVAVTYTANNKKNESQTICVWFDVESERTYGSFYADYFRDGYFNYVDGIKDGIKYFELGVDGTYQLVVTDQDTESISIRSPSDRVAIREIKPLDEVTYGYIEDVLDDLISKLIKQ